MHRKGNILLQIHYNRDGAYFYMGRGWGEYGWVLDVVAPKASRIQRRAFAVLIHNLRIAVDVGATMVVSRKAVEYTKVPEVYGYKNTIGYRPMMYALDTMISAGYMTQTPGFNGGLQFKTGLRTRVCPTDKFRELLRRSVSPELVQLLPKSRVLLRGPDKKLLPYDAFYTTAIQENLNRINDINRKHAFSAYATSDVEYNRVYSLTFTRGGRFYCNVQRLSAEERAVLTIDGEPTVELDYAALHPTLLTHQKGLSVAGDPYLAQGYIHPDNRDAAKRTLLVLLNTKSRRSALKTITSLIHHGAFPTCSLSPRDLVWALESGNPDIAEYFYTSAWAQLQYTDSQLAEFIMITFARLGKPILGIHDSFVVKASDRDLLHATMLAAYARIVLAAPQPPRIT